ncbi:hypothetical protein Ancab_012844 [Ancistrocladus abbreviatus]
MGNSLIELAEPEIDDLSEQVSARIGKTDESSVVQHPRRPNLSLLQIPARSLEYVSSSLMKSDGPAVSSPCSTRMGLPPRPSSASFKSKIKNKLPQGSFCLKTMSQEGEKTVLISSNTLTSEGPSDKPSTSRSFSLNSMFSSPSKQQVYSLPVTPIAKSGPKSIQERHLNLDDHSTDNLSVTLVVDFQLDKFVLSCSVYS